MVSNQVLGARAAAGLLSLCLALSGCAHHRAKESAPAAAPTASSASTAGTAAASPAPEQMTATEAALGNTEPAAPSASADTGATAVGGTAIPEANPSAPMHYTVKKGDTLWGIASMYLKDPWLWPEVWIINPQVPNPHLIYPGDKLALGYGAGGRMEVRLEEAGLTRLDPRLRSDPLASAIPTIPYSAIAAFLSRPTLLSEDEIRHAPYVLAFRDMHQVAGNEIDVYIRNLKAGENARFAVMHVSTPLVDPDDGKVLGIEPGSVLAVDQAGEVVRDLWANGRSITNSMNGFNTTFVPRVRLPDERAGTMLVFKVYDRMSYGLIVGASNIIHIGAPVHTP